MYALPCLTLSLSLSLCCPAQGGSYGAPGEPYPPGETRTPSGSSAASAGGSTVAGYSQPSSESATAGGYNYSGDTSSSNTTGYNYSSGAGYDHNYQGYSGYRSQDSATSPPIHPQSSAATNSTPSQQQSLYPPSSSSSSTYSQTNSVPPLSSSSTLSEYKPKRLHISNIPFRFREADLRQLFYVSFWAASGVVMAELQIRLWVWLAKVKF